MKAAPDDSRQSTMPQAFTKALPDNGAYHPLLEGVPQTCGMRSGRVYLQPGDSCGRHSTKAHEEMLTFLAGTGRVLLDGGTLNVAAGRIAYIPPHTEHDVENTGTEPLVYIYCVAPVAKSRSEL